MSYAKTLPRPYYVGVTLRPDEYERVATVAKQKRVSMAEALRLNCPDFFVETDVKCGRVPGVSPWRRTG